MQRGDGSHQHAEVGDGEAQQVHVHHAWTPQLQCLYNNTIGNNWHDIKKVFLK